MNMMRVRTQEKGLFLVCENNCACIENRLFIGDPARIRQILLNLFSNAIKFTESGGVTISIECVPTEKEKVEMLYLSVKDTGIGIAADKLETIFEKFVQADSSISRRYGGTGLGLAITKTLVEVMDGEIKVESLQGQGSEFKVSLPLTVTATSSETAVQSYQKEKDAQQEAARRPCILLVEDYAPNILVAGTFLDSFGYDYDEAQSGTAALEKIVSRRFAAVLMDVQMPGMSGLEVTNRIREREALENLPRLPIIGMTAHALAGDRERFLAGGMDDYIAKPFKPEELKQVLKIAVGE
jgi:CheY-like chemotaxis protein